MTLIELLEHCQWILSDGRTLKDCHSHLISAGVHPAVVKAIVEGLNADGTYRRTIL